MVETVWQVVEALKCEWKGFYDKVAKPRRCIFCGGSRIWWNGWRQRTASVLVGERVVYVNEVACRLVKCATPSCRKSWTLRPPGLVPQRHYQLGVVAHALSGYLFDPDASLEEVAEASGCARRSVARWIEWVAGVATPADLLGHLVDASGATEVPSMPEVAALTRKAHSTVRRAMLRCSAQVLSLLEALGHALCLPPPGLGAVVEAVVAGRYRATTLGRPRLLEFARRPLGLLGVTLSM